MPQNVIKYFSIILIVCMLIPHNGLANDEPVRNVRAAVDGRTIEIRYDLLPEQENGRYTVSIEISDNGGRTYEVVPHMIAGDLGRDITPGRNKRIVWMVERDFPRGIDIDRYEFSISAKRQGFNRNILYVLLGAVVAGGGTAAYFIFGADDDEGFPQPPGRPE